MCDCAINLLGLNAQEGTGGIQLLTDEGLLSNFFGQVTFGNQPVTPPPLGGVAGFNRKGRGGGVWSPPCG